MKDKKEQIKKMFGLIHGKDYTKDAELDKYVRAADAYLGSLCIPSAGDTYSEEAVNELDAIGETAYTSLQLACASILGPVLPDDEAYEELLNDDRVSFVYDERDFAAVFYHY